jgi:hypothetical protein
VSDVIEYNRWPDLNQEHNASKPHYMNTITQREAWQSITGRIPQNVRRNYNNEITSNRIMVWKDGHTCVETIEHDYKRDQIVPNNQENKL